MNAAHSNTSLPTTIPAYLAQLRASLAGADPALVQDALYDAEEYLRSELVANPDKNEGEVIASVASSYGAPEEVADIYRETETRVQTALRAPPPPSRTSAWGRFFGVIGDTRTYGSLFYMLLTMATGTFYFTWVVTGLSMSLGLAVLIIGIPFVILYFGSVRVLSLVEGRIVEVMLGERMPRRPLYGARDKPWMQRIADMFTDPRTWSTQLYFVLMLPLGIVYFTVVTTLLSVALSFIASPLLVLIGTIDNRWFVGDWWFDNVINLWWQLPLLFVSGVVLLFATLHLARGVGKVHGQFAKHMLVKSAQNV